MLLVWEKRGVRFRKEEQLLKAEEEAKRRMEGADARRKEHRRGIVRKANDANSKVRRAMLWLLRPAVQGTDTPTFENEAHRSESTSALRSIGDMTGSICSGGLVLVFVEVAVQSVGSLLSNL